MCIRDSSHCSESKYIEASWVTAAVCSWTSDNISSVRGKGIWYYSHRCHTWLWGTVHIQTRRLSAVFTVVRAEHTDTVVCYSNARRSDISRVHSAAGRWHRLTDCTDTDGQASVQRSPWKCFHHSADYVSVSDDTVSVEATSLSDVTGSHTRLHWTRSETTFSRLDSEPSHIEIDKTQSSDVCEDDVLIESSNVTHVCKWFTACNQLTYRF